MKPPKPAHEVALALLARREHAVSELRRKLAQKGYDAAEVKAVMADMQARGYVDDARYALARARYRVLQSRWGWQRVAQELAMAGIEPDLVTAARQALEDEGVSLSAGAAVVARRKLGKVGVLDKEAVFKQRQKALSALVRKGYSLSEAKEALDAAENAG